VSKKFAQHLLLSPNIHPEMLCRQIGFIEQGVETLCQMVCGLRHGPHLDRVQEQNNLLHRYEGEADKLMLNLLKDLYSGQYDALQMIVMRDLIELLEKVIDRCRDAGNVVFQIVLKNS
jgi:uncharacterized protein